MLLKAEPDAIGNRENAEKYNENREFKLLFERKQK